MSVAILCAAFAAPLSVRAESVVWNGVAPSMEYTYTHNDTSYGNNVGINQELYDPNVSVRYDASVFEVDGNGAKIRQLPSGASVPSGTRVLYEFRPHEYTDITYNGTGGISDTPYGVWASNASLPTGQPICVPEYHYDSARSRLQYAVLSGNPPTETITGLPPGCAVTSDGVSRICTVTEGTITTEFRFGATAARFYAGYTHSPPRTWLTTTNPNACEAAGQQPMHMIAQGANELLAGSDSNTSTVTDIPIPAQSISHTLTVSAISGNAPAAPTLSHAAACTIGTANTLTMSASDPDGDNIRYGIDWNADGSVDEYVPASGYVPSGTAQNASRTYATEGTKTVKVLSQTEDGAVSPWATISFDCSNSPHEAISCPSDQHAVGTLCICNATGYPADTEGQCTMQACPSGFQYDPGSRQCVAVNQCALPATCVDATHALNQCTGVTTNCSTYGTGWRCVNGMCAVPPPPTASIVAVPSLVHRGNTARVSWASSNTASCTVTGDNGDGPWNGTTDSHTTSAIQAPTTYTLTCAGFDGSPYSQTATLKLLPDFQEK